MVWHELVEHLVATPAGRRLRRLYRWLAAGYGVRSFILTAGLILAGWIATSMLTTTPERPSAPHHSCSESWWEGSGRDGTPCP